MIVYVLVAEAVYGQGVIGVYASEQEARDVAEEIWPTTDGHHRFRIDVLRLGDTDADVFEHFFSEKDVPPVEHVYRAGSAPDCNPRPVDIEVNVRTNVDAPSPQE